MNLSPSQFADEISVQRSSLSHILSGRNKPSLDFVTKLLTSYPEINSDWLLFGKGTMISKAVKPEPVMLKEEKKVEDTVPKAAEKPEEKSLPAKTRESDPKTAILPTGKTIGEIILLFDDSTFRIYKPSKD